MSNGNTIEQAVAELQEWAAETGRPLPYTPRVIAMAEQTGAVINLNWGVAETAIADDGVHTLDDQAWLAGLEQACGGSVRVAWAIQPAEYFAMVERGEL